MAIEIPSGTTQYNLSESSVTYILKQGVTRSASDNDAVIFGDGTVHDDKVVINGTVTQTGAAFGVQLSGMNMVLQVGSQGSISAASGVEFAGDGAKLVNAGDITAAYADGVYFEGSNTEIDNTGNISSPVTGIFANGPNATINNDGKISGGSFAIHSEGTEAADKVHIVNNGQIIGENGAFAIDLGDGNDTVVNRSTITGQISLGTGKDIFDARGGTVDHKIVGGAGDDTLITDQATVKLQENGGSEGFDTVKSTVSYTLSANVERLILLGHANLTGKGNQVGNVLLGNTGDNKLFGVNGDGSDTFIFRTGGGHDTLMDFNHGIDEIDVSKWHGMVDFHDIKQHATDVGADVHITLDGDELIIKDIHKADLRAGDFLFHSV